MSSLGSLLGGDPNAYKPGYVYRNGQWVPEYIASPGGPGPAAMDDSYTRAEENRVQTLSQTQSRARTDINAGGGGYGLPSNLNGMMGAGGSADTIARQKYGYLAGFLNHPEVGPILRRAASEGWGELELYGAISKTNFWKNNSAAQRTWWQLQNEDPAEARRQVAQTAATITNRAKTLGVNVNVGALAAAATANGWTDAQTIDAIIQQVNWATLESGDLTAMRDDVKAIGSDYLVGVSEQTAQNYAARIASGEMSMEGVRSAMLKQAKARFGWMADELDQGMTVKDYFAPVKDVIARELGVAHEEVNLMDSKYLKMVEKKDEQTGKMRAATLDEAMLTARRDPRFATSQKAKEMSTNLTGMITEIFGRR